MASANQATRRLRVAPNALLRSFPADANLTAREHAILIDIVEGRSSKDIARSLDISPRTVEFHRANLLRKCGVKNTAELLRKVFGLFRSC